jgi:hypothetical protein
MTRLAVIRMTNRATRLATLLMVVCGITLVHGFASPVSTGKYLYTKPDPSATGGIRGTIARSGKDVLGVYALPPSEPKSVYKAQLSGSMNGEFSLKGLPADRYDLVVLFKDACFEGLTLIREEDSLTSKDHQNIEKSVQKSEPFFDTKFVHRVAGTTGRANLARCFAEYLRTRKMLDINDTVYTDHRRSIRLIILKDVGPGWQFVRSREIDVRFFKPGGKMTHHYTKKLSRIRVIDTVKELGQIQLR